MTFKKNSKLSLKKMVFPPKKHMAQQAVNTSWGECVGFVIGGFFKYTVPLICTPITELSFEQTECTSNSDTNSVKYFCATFEVSKLILGTLAKCSLFSKPKQYNKANLSKSVIHRIYNFS